MSCPANSELKVMKKFIDINSFMKKFMKKFILKNFFMKKFLSMNLFMPSNADR
jgi:hypothetical protein